MLSFIFILFFIYADSPSKMDSPTEGLVFFLIFFIYGLNVQWTLKKKVIYADSTSKWTLEKKVYFYFYFVLYLRRLNVQMDPEEEEGLVFF